MTEQRDWTDVHRTLGVEILAYLRERHPEGVRRTELEKRFHTSQPTVLRTLKWLRDDQDAPIEYDAALQGWRLTDPSFGLPLLSPQDEDLAALVIAAASVAAVADEETARRLDRLVEQIDDRMRSHGRQPQAGDPEGIVATVTTATRFDRALVLKLLSGCRRKVLRIQYESPWREDGPKTYEIEPWQVRLHDGMLYLRAYSRSAEAPRNFRVVNIRSAVVLDGVEPRAPRPARAVWGDEDPAYGLDHDRPDTARIRVRGPMARWLADVRMHPGQTDTWIEPGVLLERTVPYRSCREFARRLLFLGDALVHVEPPALAEAIRAHGRALAAVPSGGSDDGGEGVPGEGAP